MDSETTTNDRTREEGNMDSKDYRDGYAHGKSGEPWRHGDPSNEDYRRGHDDGRSDWLDSIHGRDRDMDGIGLVTI